MLFPLGGGEVNTEGKGETLPPGDFRVWWQYLLSGKGQQGLAFWGAGPVGGGHAF